MPIDAEENLVFIHLPKNAGTAITNAQNMKPEGHHSYTFYEQQLDLSEFDVFTVVRNPYDRFVSAYEYATMEKSYWHSQDGSTPYGEHPDYQLLKDKSFKECVELYYYSSEEFDSKSWKSQTYWLKEQNIDKIDIFQYEDNFESQINQQYNITLNLPEVNRTKKEKNEYKEYYTSELALKVFQCYSKDFSNFGYKHEELL